MTLKKKKNSKYNKVKTVTELGAVIREFRKEQKLSLEKISAITSLGMRFLSEIERGKETAEFGKVLHLLESIGLEMILVPRSYKNILEETISDE